MLKQQIVQQASSSSIPPSRLPSKPELKPKEHCNCIILRSGKQLEDPKTTKVEVESDDYHNENGSPFPSEDEPKKKNESEKPKEPKLLSPNPYMSHFPFPQRFAKAKLDSQFVKFLVVHKMLQANIPFMDALS